MRRAAIAAYAIALAAVPAHGTEPATFRGLQFGAAITQQIPECPRSQSGFYDMKLERDTCYERNSSCFLTDPPAHLNCTEATTVNFRDSLRDVIWFRAFVLQADGSLEGLESPIPTANFGQIVDLLTAKYGKPAAASSEPWQSTGGVRTTAQIRVWKWRGLTIRLKAPGDRVDQGSLLITTERWTKAALKERGRGLQKHLGDL